MRFIVCIRPSQVSRLATLRWPDDFNIKNMDKVNISEKFTQFNDYYNPRIIGELNGQAVKAVKLKGEFVWHHHDHEDEMFLVIEGKLNMEFRDKTVEVMPGEFIIVPKGMEHKPVAEEEVHLLLFEPASTLNTGNVENERTRKVLEKI
jgi:mannose-6-phosphate isomerase-like protein (cupin superfamily)